MPGAKICGAGILPFFVTQDGNIVFALAREKYVPGWRGSSRWSAFEGGSKPGEDDIQTSVREFIEESIGAFSMNSNDVADDLRRQSYAMRVVVRNCSNSNAEHVTYVKQFPYHLDPVHAFNRSKRTLEHILDQARCVRRARDRVSRKFPFYTGGEAISTWTGEERVTGIKSVAVIDTIMTVKLLVDISGEIREHIVVWIAVSSDDVEECAAFQDWQRNRVELTNYLKENEAHLPCGACSYSLDGAGYITNAFVNTDFLEKSEMRLWSYDELRAALSNPYLMDSAFRPFFSLVIDRVISDFSAPRTPSSSRDRTGVQQSL